MLKTVLVAFLIALGLLASCTQPSPPPTKDEKAADRNLLPQAQVTTVRVEFNGLMVFHKEKDKINYEVGVLSPKISHDHKFTVEVDRDPKTLTNGRRWTLEVTNSIPPITAPPVDGKITRLQDTVASQYNFSWIVDLESKEFHNRILDLKKDLLAPIIRLPAASLYTLNKSIDLLRRKGNGDPEEFGFVSETIAMNIQLQPNQELVLKDDSSGTPIFKISYSAASPTHVVTIENVRRPPVEESDFWMYYQLFNGFDDDKEQPFDFAENKGSTRKPFNPSPYREVIRLYKLAPPTCCGLLCDAILLGSRTEPLW